MPLSKFYGNSVYIPIGCLLSVSLFFSTMNMVPNALLMKEKKFVRIGLRMITTTVVSSGIAIVLAKLGLKYYALAAQSIICLLYTSGYITTDEKINGVVSATVDNQNVYTVLGGKDRCV